jgi:hypothetical protein
MREYIEVNGTEKAYDSGLDVGNSINTPSVTGLQDVDNDRQRVRYLRPRQASPLS